MDSLYPGTSISYIIEKLVCMATSITGDTPILEAPRCAVGKSWPIPVHQRLEQLVKMAQADGQRTSGTELLAAIVAAFEPTPESIETALKHYRRCVARDLVINEPQGDVLHFEPRARGRPVAR